LNKEKNYEVHSLIPPVWMANTYPLKVIVYINNIPNVSTCFPEVVGNGNEIWKKKVHEGKGFTRVL
jgi:hypothetical protein